MTKPNLPAFILLVISNIIMTVNATSAICKLAYTTEPSGVDRFIAFLSAISIVLITLVILESYANMGDNQK